MIGANDRINVGVIGCGGRGTYVASEFAQGRRARTTPARSPPFATCMKSARKPNAGQVRRQRLLDYRELLAKEDVDAVIVATPDHWHAQDRARRHGRGKDVYLEKPMCHTIEEAQQLVDTVKETKRVLQVGSQTTSGDQWCKAKKAIADGMIGQMLMSQGSYHRNSIEGEWNWPIDAEAGSRRQGRGLHRLEDVARVRRTKRTWDADRFFRFRKYWDYSGGIATDLFYHVVAPLNICWGEPQFPHRVMADGGIYVFKNRPRIRAADREVPDTFHLIGDVREGPLAGAQLLDGELPAHSRA